MNFNFDIQFDYNSKVIITYLIISLIACLLNYLTRGKSNKLLFENYRSSPLNPLTYLRMFTHSIGHRDWDHLVGNFLYILLIGPMIEEKYGSINKANKKKFKNLKGDIQNGRSIYGRRF